MKFPKSRAFFVHIVLLVYVLWVFTGPFLYDAVGKRFPATGSGSGVSISDLLPFERENPSVDLRLFYEAYRTVRENYYGFDTISKTELVSGMVKGMVDALHDKHSEYFNLEETKKFNESISGDFEGIGAVVAKSDFWVLVKQILAGSPAKESGILAGDIISRAGTEKLENLTLPEAIEKIRGPAGTPVELEIFRSGEGAPIVKTVIRRKITVPSVDGKILEGTKTAHIILSIFGEKTAFEFLKTYVDLEKQGADSLILDLRDNGGGLLETSVNLLSNFVERDKVLVTTKEKNPFLNRSYFSYGPGDITVPLVVLVNENSASASEITAGALKDYAKAIIVGVKTYGKGSVQQPFTLSDGSEMKITVAKWYTPLDHIIDKVGIEPDVESKLTKEDYEKAYDRQLEEAKKIVESWKKSWREATLAEYRSRNEQAMEEAKKSQMASGSLKTPKKDVPR